MMNRIKLTFFMGTGFLFFCLASDAKMSVAQEKAEELKLITCVCNQVPLAPAGTDLWTWLAYRYQYETDCTAATAVSIINYSPFDSYPETLCAGSGDCGDSCSQAKKKSQIKNATEPVTRHYMHPLPARPTARLDLYPPETELHYQVLDTRFMIFGSSKPDQKYAKVFLICLSKSENPDEQSDSVYFWYGFEVENLSDTQESSAMRIPYNYSQKRAMFRMEDRAGNWSEGQCREFSSINFGGSQYLIRFKS